MVLCKWFLQYHDKIMTHNDQMMQTIFSKDISYDIKCYYCTQSKSWWLGRTDLLQFQLPALSTVNISKHLTTKQFSIKCRTQGIYQTWKWRRGKNWTYNVSLWWMTVNYFSAMPIYSVWSVAVSGMLMVEDQSCGCWKIMKTIREKIAQGSGPIVYLVFCICVTLAVAAGLGNNATVLPLVIYFWLLLALFKLIHFIPSMWIHTFVLCITVNPYSNGWVISLLFHLAWPGVNIGSEHNPQYTDKLSSI